MRLHKVVFFDAALFKNNSIELILLLISCLLFYDVSWKLLVVVSIIIFLKNIVNNRILPIDSYSRILIITLLSYAFFGISTGAMNLRAVFSFCIPSFIFYFYGCLVSLRSSDEYSFFFCILFFIIALSIPHLIITIQDILANGLINPGRALNILDDDTQRPVTQRVIDISLSLGGVSFIFFDSKDSVINQYKRIFIVFSIIALLCGLHYVSRTAVVLFAVAIIIGILFRWKSAPVQSLLFIVIVLIAWYLLSDNPIFQLYADREWEGSNFGNAGGRTGRWLYVFNDIIHNPFAGGGYERIQSYAHNFWLDFGSIGGIIPFLFLVLFSLLNILDSIRLIRSKKEKSSIKFVVILYTTLFVLTSFTEPIHLGNELYTFFFFFWCGLVHYRYKFIAVRRRCFTKAYVAFHTLPPGQ